MSNGRQTTFDPVLRLAIGLCVAGFFTILAGLLIGPIYGAQAFGALDLAYFNPHELRAVGLTFFATVVTWVASGCIGYMSALILGSISKLAGRRATLFVRFFGDTVDLVYSIPLVITISLGFTLLLLLLQGGVSMMVIMSLLLLVTVLSLSGYQLFQAVFIATIDSDPSDDLFVDALSTPGSSSKIWRAVVAARRLIDIRIDLLMAALPRSFLLAGVAVVTLEAVRGPLYEFFFPQTGFSPPELGGVGYIVTRAQAAADLPSVLRITLALLVANVVGLVTIATAYYQAIGKYYTREN